MMRQSDYMDMAFVALARARDCLTLARSDVFTLSERLKIIGDAFGHLEKAEIYAAPNAIARFKARSRIHGLIDPKQLEGGA